MITLNFIKFRLKTTQAKQNQKAEAKVTMNGHDEDSLRATSGTNSKRGSDDEEDSGKESGHDSDDTHATGNVSEQEVMKPSMAHVSI